MKNANFRKITVFLLAMTAAAGLICGCSKQQEQIPETTSAAVQETVAAETESSAATEPVAQMHTIETAYIPLYVSENYMQDLIHQEVVEGTVAMEIFSTQSSDAVRELFRIYFNDPQGFKVIGNLKIGEDLIPVSVSVAEYTAESFQDEETANHYYFMMDALNDILTSVRDHESFTSENTAVVDIKDSAVSYWTFSLPEGMELEETAGTDSYSITFYGMIGQQKINLYTVAVSDSTLSTVLGMYTTEAFTKPISIESYDLPDTSAWAQNDVMQLYTMMDSINDTIQVIVSSEQFSQIPEGE